MGSIPLDMWWFGLVLFFYGGFFCGPCCRMRATGVWWVRVRLFSDRGLGMEIGVVLIVRFVLVRLLGRGFMLT